jgi:SulP family sulfate permease
MSGAAIRQPFKALTSNASGDLVGGLCSSIVGIAYGLTFAHLIFAPPLTPWVAYGLAATFITMAVAALVMSLTSRLPFVIAGPDGATAAVTAAMITGLMRELEQVGEPDDLLAPVMVLIAIATITAGAVLSIIGFLRAGNAVRFIPYPVIGGFLAATGWLMTIGGIGMVAGRSISFTSLSLLGDVNLACELVAAGAVAAAIFLLRRWQAGAFSVPIVLLVGVLATHLVLQVAGIDLATAQQAGWLIKAPQSVGMTPTWNVDDLMMFPWRILPNIGGDIIAMIFVTTVTMLLNTSGIEFIVKKDVALEHELKWLGLANVTSGLLGGYVNCTSLSRTTLNYSVGGRGRLSGVIVAVVSVCMLFLGGGFIAYIPKFILGGLMLNLGLDIMRKQIIDTRRTIPALDYAALLVVALVIIKWGFVAGVIIGILAGCMTFAFSASRISCIKFRFDGAEYNSSLDRNPEELAILNAHRHEIQGLILQSYLFFGSTNRLYEFVKALLLVRPQCRFLLFDLGLVNGVDSSAMHSFAQIKRIASGHGARLVLINVPADLRERFRDMLGPDDMMSDDFDRALELCENGVIAHQKKIGEEAGDFANWLTQTLGDPNFTEDLFRACKRCDFARGDVIASQGAAADCMHFIMQGRVGIMVKRDDGASTRVRSLGAHSTVGEMGLLTGENRNASVVAETDCTLYRLGIEEFQRLKLERPDITQALLTYVISVMAHRLRFASNLIAVLRR